MYSVRHNNRPDRITIGYRIRFRGFYNNFMLMVSFPFELFNLILYFGGLFGSKKFKLYVIFLTSSYIHIDVLPYFFHILTHIQYLQLILIITYYLIFLVLNFAFHA